MTTKGDKMPGDQKNRKFKEALLDEIIGKVYGTTLPFKEYLKQNPGLQRMFQEIETARRKSETKEQLLIALMKIIQKIDDNKTYKK